MRKRNVLLIVLMVMVIFAGCTNNQANEGNSFTATVLEVNDASLLVEPAEGSAELNSADKIVVSFKDAALINSEGTEITVEDIEVGKKVKVSYKGGIAESYPAQVQGCYEIRLLD